MPTIGVAVGIPEPHASFLQAARRAAGDIQAERIRTHLTLLLPTTVPSVQDNQIEQHLSAVAAQHRRFALELGQVGTFRPVSPVQFLQVTRGSTACTDLAADIRTGPLAQELSYPYHPHVTLAHQVSDEALDAVGAALAHYQLQLEVASFQLYQQRPDGQWLLVRSFALAEAPHAERRAGYGLGEV